MMGTEAWETNDAESECYCGVWLKFNPFCNISKLLIWGLDKIARHTVVNKYTAWEVRKLLISIGSFRHFKNKCTLYFSVLKNKNTQWKQWKGIWKRRTYMTIVKFSNIISRDRLQWFNSFTLIRSVQFLRGSTDSRLSKSL